MVMVEVPEPGAAMDAGVKLTVTPVGCPVADKATAELKPPETANRDRWIASVTSGDRNEARRRGNSEVGSLPERSPST